MKIKSVFDSEFAQYGKILEGYDFTDLLNKLDEVTDCPKDATLYFPGVDELEALPIAKTISDNIYGGMPVQIGCCNGFNKKLNCLEYHRDSEIDIASNDVILLLASQQKIKDSKLSTSEVEAFLLPKGYAAELYATSLHYAPVCPEGADGFRVVIVLPKGTNTDKPEIEIKNAEDKMLFARNKWLIAHPDASEASQGAVVGLEGENITLA